MTDIGLNEGHGVRRWGGPERLEQRYDIEAVLSPEGFAHPTLTRG
jgi:hypothetical protein